MENYDETLKLLHNAKLGDNQAKNLLIEKNSPLVKSVVRRYKNKGVEYDDLYQLGCMGFVKAINNFDEGFNVKFSTYAVPMIAGEIKRFLRDDGSVKVSRSIKNQNYIMQKNKDSVRRERGEAPSILELSKKFDIEPEITSKIAKKKVKIKEVPISYYPRTNEEGKKIGFKDSLYTGFCLRC